MSNRFDKLAPDDRATRRRTMKDEMAALKNLAIAKLERRGYEVPRQDNVANPANTQAASDQAADGIARFVTSLAPHPNGLGNSTPNAALSKARTIW